MNLNNISAEIPPLDLEVVVELAHSLSVDTSQIKIECNQKGSAQDEGVEKLFDTSKDTNWAVTFKPKETCVKMILSEPIEFTGYTLVLGKDHPGRDPVEWRVRTKEKATLNVYEDTHKIDDWSESKCQRGSSQDFKMRTQRRVSEISFHYDKVKDGDMIQLCQIILNALGNKKSSEEKRSSESKVITTSN